VSYTIPDDSPKRQAALRVGAELTRALEVQGLSLKALSRALGGTSHTKLWQYKRGRILPRLSTAVEISEALAWPRIAELVREFRSKPCHQCGRMFVMEGGSANKRYCGDRCRGAALRLRAHTQQAESAEDDPERRLVARIKAELGRVRGRAGATVSRLELRDAVAEFERTAPQSRTRRALQDRDRHIAAVEAFCNGCEPEGMCRDAGCPLRAVSPLPLSEMRDVEAAVRAPGRWAQPGARERHTADMRRRHAANPSWAEGIRQRNLQRWAAMSPSERAEIARKISAANKGRASFRACGCPNRAHRRDCALAPRLDRVVGE